MFFGVLKLHTWSRFTNMLIKLYFAHKFETENVQKATRTPRIVFKPFLEGSILNYQTEFLHKIGSNCCDVPKGYQF